MPYIGTYLKVLTLHLNTVCLSGMYGQWSIRNIPQDGGTNKRFIFSITVNDIEGLSKGFKLIFHKS